MTTVNILHRTDRSMFWEIAKARELGDLPTLVNAYSYEDDDLNGNGEFLERIWRANNRVDGSAIEVVPDGHRSLSVGDVVRIGDGFASRCYEVRDVGFAPTSPIDVALMLLSS